MNFDLFFKIDAELETIADNHVSHGLVYLAETIYELNKEFIRFSRDAYSKLDYFESVEDNEHY